MECDDEDVRMKTIVIAMSIIRSEVSSLKEGEKHPYLNKLLEDGTIEKIIKLFRDKSKENIHENIAVTVAFLFKATKMKDDYRKEVIDMLKIMWCLYIEVIKLLAECEDNHDSLLSNDFEKKLFIYEYQAYESLLLSKLFLKYDKFLLNYEDIHASHSSYTVLKLSDGNFDKETIIPNLKQTLIAYAEANHNKQSSKDKDQRYTDLIHELDEINSKDDYESAFAFYEDIMMAVQKLGDPRVHFEPPCLHDINYLLPFGVKLSCDQYKSIESCHIHAKKAVHGYVPSQTRTIDLRGLVILKIKLDGSAIQETDEPAAVTISYWAQENIIPVNSPVLQMNKALNGQFELRPAVKFVMPKNDSFTVQYVDNNMKTNTSLISYFLQSKRNIENISDICEFKSSYAPLNIDALLPISNDDSNKTTFKNIRSRTLWQQSQFTPLNTISDNLGSSSVSSEQYKDLYDMVINRQVEESFAIENKGSSFNLFTMVILPVVSALILMWCFICCCRGKCCCYNCCDCCDDCCCDCLGTCCCDCCEDCCDDCFLNICCCYYICEVCKCCCGSSSSSYSSSSSSSSRSSDSAIYAIVRIQ
ncbi:MAG: hypothetical protein EZS28_009664 [Streblomastix strix]|uniref:Uncharacterized protein n=1 Tax=Streblomastix strix TaxID=222440 RepID=A0A5J4WIJ9_9EUKA|nr:MAG: hypothetical protein EZS28_009664 [Streblomastix strix]